MKGKDKQGPYFSWGRSGHHYYFKPRSKISEGMARAKAAKQGRAIKKSQNQR
jgi:hypothetical protein